MRMPRIRIIRILIRIIRIDLHHSHRLFAWAHSHIPRRRRGLRHSYAGFSLVEVLLAVSVFGLLVTALVGGLIFGQQSTAIAGARSRATLLAEEGLEAARNIRDAGFANLPTGTYGLAASGNQWSFIPTSDTTDIFTRSLAVSVVDADRMQIVSTVTWPQNPQRAGTVVLTTYLTNWSKSTPASSCDTYCISLGGYSTGTCRENTTQCTTNSEIYESEGDTFCITDFPGDPSHDTCCCLPATTPTLTPTPTPANCNQHCQYTYGTSGNCMKSNECSAHNEGTIYECSSPDICCCL